MKSKIFISLIAILLSGAWLLPGFAQGLQDDFERVSLGSNWAAAPAYYINNGQLRVNPDSVGWKSLAVFKAAANPLSVSLRFGSLASGVNTEGTNAAGIAILDSPSSTSDGYLILRRYGSLFLYPIVGGQVAAGSEIQMFSKSSPAPQPGDSLMIEPVADASGNYHEFKFYINGNLDGTLKDNSGRFGNGDIYGGIMLFGYNNYNNFVEWFKLSAPYIQVTSPNGGEQFLGGTTQTITWTSGNYSGTVDILVSYDSGATWTEIVTGTANDGSYDWSLPDLSTTTCRIKIAGSGGATDPYDTSDGDFEIEQATPTITVLSPNGGENWIIGTTQKITWNTTGSIDFVDIYYTPDDGITRNLIQGSVPAEIGYFDWYVPTNLFADSLKIIIEKSVLDQVYSDMSDGYFSVSALAHLYVHDASGEPGTNDNIVRVGLDNKTNIRAVMFKVTDSKSALQVPILDASETPPILKVNAVGRAQNFTIRARQAANYVKLSIVSLSGVIPAGSGPIAEIYYNITNDPTLINDHSDMTLSEVEIIDANTQFLVPKISHGKFHYVKAGDLVAPFDVVDDDDIYQMVQVALGVIAPDPYLLSGDMDNDGDIDMFDVLNVYDLAYPDVP
jgi:hypothetical protein